MTYKFREYSGEPRHCCLVMDLMLDEEYLIELIDLTGKKESTPYIVGPYLTKSGSRRKPHMQITYCPGCGKKLVDDQQEVQS